MNTFHSIKVKRDTKDGLSDWSIDFRNSVLLQERK